MADLPWCPFCFKEVSEADTDHEAEVDHVGDLVLTTCNVYGRDL